MSVLQNETQCAHGAGTYRCSILEKVQHCHTSIHTLKVCNHINSIILNFTPWKLRFSIRTKLIFYHYYSEILDPFFAYKPVYLCAMQFTFKNSWPIHFSLNIQTMAVLSFIQFTSSYQHTCILSADAFMFFTYRLASQTLAYDCSVMAAWLRAFWWRLTARCNKMVPSLSLLKWIRSSLARHHCCVMRRDQ